MGYTTCKQSDEKGVEKRKLQKTEEDEEMHHSAPSPRQPSHAQPGAAAAVKSTLPLPAAPAAAMRASPAASPHDYETAGGYIPFTRHLV